MNNSTLKKTANWFRCVGTLSESSLKEEECSVKVKDKEGNVSNKKGKRIRGNISMETKNGTFTFNVYAQTPTSQGEKNNRWTMYESMLNWNPQIGGDNSLPVTKACVEGQVSINDYVSQQDGKVKTTLRWSISKGTTKVKDDESGVTLEATGFIQSVKPEIKNDEETGRLLVTLYGADNNGSCYPINCVVEEKLVDAFEEYYEVGETASFTLDRVMHHVGPQRRTVQRALGGYGSVNVNAGYDTEELVVVGADEPIEEPDELYTEDDEGNEIPVETDWINPETMKKAIKIRNQMLKEMEEKGPVKKESVSNMLKKAKSVSKKSQSKFDDFDDFDEEETPFDAEVENDDEDFESLY